MLVGYKLLDSSNNEISSWGGVWGQTPTVPNPLFLPNGGIIHCPDVEVDYEGYRLIEWNMETEPVNVPKSITPRQIRLALLSVNLLDDVESLLLQESRAAQIAWEFATEILRTDPLLNNMAAALNLTQSEVDQLFIEASKL